MGRDHAACLLAKDTTSEFDTDTPIVDWLRQYASKEEDDNTFLRSFLGRMLFSGDEVLNPSMFFPGRKSSLHVVENDAFKSQRVGVG